MHWRVNRQDDDDDDDDDDNDDDDDDEEEQEEDDDDNDDDFVFQWVKFELYSLLSDKLPMECLPGCIVCMSKYK